MKRVLVTGATGFTAGYVIPRLREQGYGVHGLSSIDCDIRDASGLRHAVAAVKPDYAIHLAGTPNLPEREAELAFTINVLGTRNLLEACAALQSPPRKIILTSSSYVYGDTGANAVGEDVPLNPAGAYGKSKLEMEEVAKGWMSRLPILVVRPFNYTGLGHGERFLIPKLVRAFRERATDVSFVDPDVRRDFSDVRWVASTYVRLLQRPEASMVINVCSGSGMPLPDIVHALQRLTGHHPATLPPPAGRNHQTSQVGSPARLHGLLGETFPYSLDTTLSWMIAG